MALKYGGDKAATFNERDNMINFLHMHHETMTQVHLISIIMNNKAIMIYSLFLGERNTSLTFEKQTKVINEMLCPTICSF